MFNIMALAVDQGQGIGTQLMLAIEAEAKKLGISTIRLNSNTKRTGAHQFYRKIGYSYDKTQKRFSKQV